MKSSKTVAVVFLLAGATACNTKITAVGDTPAPAPASGAFSHERLDRVLTRYVNERGRVDYSALNLGQDELDSYFQLLERYGPERNPELFPTESSRLAYWINAYNAATITIVLHYYPIDTVLDVKKPTLAFFLPRTAGFFYFQKVRLGGEAMSLYHLENDIIRKRFDEPRIHFALNCASLSCPELPRRAFTADNLENELEREARKFLSQSRNLRIDHENQTIYLSEIFDWYRDDFVSWLRQRSSNQTGGLLDYIALYVEAETADDLRQAAKTYAVSFIPYDWTLNDRTEPTIASP